MAIKDTSSVTANANRVAPDLAAVIYKQNLDALEETFRQFHVRSNTYAILQEKDNCFCLNYENGEWITFISERGESFDISHFDDVNSACLFMIEEMAETKVEANQMTMYYKSQIDNPFAAKGVPSATLFDAIKAMCEKLRGLSAIY